ncbi:MAG: hypothetical protein Q7J27_14000 [Syntrophales bacterium]|nr:hypothetical protein [Syntrophales bacterium]
MANPTKNSFQTKKAGDSSASMLHMNAVREIAEKRWKFKELGAWLAVSALMTCMDQNMPGGSLRFTTCDQLQKLRAP